MKIRPLTIALFAGLAAGCTVGPEHTVTPDGKIVSNKAPAPNRVTLTKEGETWATESSVPGAFVRFFDEGGTNLEALGPKTRVFSIPWLNGAVARVASDEDTVFSVDELKTGDGTIIKGLRLSTLSSPVVKAQNEVWVQLAPIIINRDSEQARVFLANADAVKSAIAAVGPGIVDVLKIVAAGK